MHVNDAADEVTRKVFVCAYAEDVIEQLLTLNPRPIVVALVDRDGECRIVAGQKAIDAGLGSLHAISLRFLFASRQPIGVCD